MSECERGKRKSHFLDSSVCLHFFSSVGRKVIWFVVSY